MMLMLHILAACSAAAAVGSGAAGSAATPASAAAAAPAAWPPYAASAAVLADRLTACSYSPALGVFVGEGLWQTGSTLETVGDALLAAAPPLPPRLRSSLLAVLEASYARLPAIVDNCFDDHQWYGHAWAVAHQATGNASYLLRAGQVFEYVAARGWETSVCGGGVTWCPPPTSPYKNAITSELFLSLAMALHPHAAELGKAPTYYSDWGARAWAWLAASGMRNSQSLLNDGLQGGTCVNNGQTTWTYNQGVLLSGLARLSAATGDPAPLAAAVAIANASFALLTVDGVLSEPCPGGQCGQDGHIFKGVFVRHLGYLLQAPGLPPGFAAQAAAFLAANADALLAQDACRDGGYGFRWGELQCDVEDPATDSAALDLLLAASAHAAPPPPGNASAPAWALLGLGNCQDAAGASMPNCFQDGLSLAACRDAAVVTPGAVAYDFHLPCLAEGVGFCRVRTLAGQGACQGGLQYEGGSGTSVAQGDGSALTACYVRSASA